MKTTLLLTLTLLLTACSNESRLAINRPITGGFWGMMISSPAFRNGEEIPEKYTANGQNISPPLNWSKGPDGTRQFMLVVEDANSSGKQPALHWLVYQLPPNVTSLPENAAQTMNLVQGNNYQGKLGYAGPDPSGGEKHVYHFQIFALDREIKLGPGATPEQLARKLPGYVLSKGDLTGWYKR
jgi:Raf kinase inhibitor-like YbhB/YbcL family protein